MSIILETGRGAKGVILFRDAAAIENLIKVDTLTSDKTGILTKGRPAFDRKLLLERSENFDSSWGIGVKVQVGGKQLALGNSAWITQIGVFIKAIVSQVESFRDEGASVIHLAIDGQLMGFLVVSDPIKASTSEALETLKAVGIRVVMTTDDGITTARSEGARLGITELCGEINPADKLALVKRLQKVGHIGAIAWDGINVTPSMAMAGLQEG